MNNLIPYHETFDVQDSTKIQDYLTCERLYFYKYVLGYRNQDPIHDLEFGKAYHLAKEVLFSEGYSQASVDKGMKAFLKEYRKHFSEETDMDFHPKSPGNAELSLMEYILEYQDDQFKVKHTEIGITFLLPKGRVMYGKMDSIIEDEMKGMVSMDTKTSKAHWRYLEDSYQQKFQMLAYTFFLYSYYDPKDVYGVIIDQVILLKNGNSHFRIPVRPSLTNDKTKIFNTLEAWLWEADSTLDNLERDFDRLSDCKEEDIIMKAFPRRTESCVKYNRICPLFDYCNINHNPLKKLDRIPSGYKIEYWDPRKEEVKVKLEVGG